MIFPYLGGRRSKTTNRICDGFIMLFWSLVKQFRDQTRLYPTLTLANSLSAHLENISEYHPDVSGILLTFITLWSFNIAMENGLVDLRINSDFLQLC